MKARVLSSLALPAALATAGLLSTAEAAYAATFSAEHVTASAPYGYQQHPTSGDVALIADSAHPCTPMGNITISDYGHHGCTHMGNVTVSDYGHHHHSHHDYDYGDDYGDGYDDEYGDDDYWG